MEPISAYKEITTLPEAGRCFDFCLTNGDILNRLSHSNEHIVE